MVTAALGTGRSAGTTRHPWRRKAVASEKTSRASATLQPGWIPRPGSSSEGSRSITASPSEQERPRRGFSSSPPLSQEAFEVDPPFLLIRLPPPFEALFRRLDRGAFGVERLELPRGLGELRQLAEHVGEGDAQALRFRVEAQGEAVF